MTQNITLRGEIARPSAFTSILSNVLGDNAGSWMIEVMKVNVPCQLQKTSFHVFDCYMYVLIDFGVNSKKKKKTVRQ